MYYGVGCVLEAENFIRHVYLAVCLPSLYVYMCVYTDSEVVWGCARWFLPVYHRECRC